MAAVNFSGHARINIHFLNRLMWQKYRKYILKTDWDFDSGMYPSSANLDMSFQSMEDIMDICKKIIFLLHMGFEVNSCRWQLDQEYLDEMTRDPDENGELSERAFMDLWEGYQHYGQFPMEREPENDT